ncbi:MAG: helix-turn-helix domain-containing protein [Paludibacteraceae bacterium]
MNLSNTPIGMCLCVGGRAEVLINGELYELRKGSIYVISPLVQLFVLQQTEDYEVRKVENNPENVLPLRDSLFSIGISNKIYQHPVAMLDEDCQIGFCAMERRIAQKYEELRVETDEEIRGLIKQIIIQLYCTTLLEATQAFLQQRTLPPARTIKTENTTFQFLQLLHRNFHTMRNVRFYADRSGLTPNHFTHIIKQVTGRTPMEWIADITIIEAKKQLARKGARVQEVANRLNFPEQYTFSRYFKTHTGITPRDFQRQLFSTEQ